MSKLEIERRYLFNSCNIHKLLKRRGISYIIISMEQFYLKASSKETLRYRKEDDKYIKNIKKGSGLVREEFEEEVDKATYKKAKLANSGGVIKKSRLKFYINGNKFELDIFKDKLEGLSILEVEFANLKEANKFKLPKFLKKYIIKEITNENIYSNGAISKSMKIPLRDDSYISLKEILASKEKLKEPKFDLYISEYEDTKSALKNYFNRFASSFVVNYSDFLKYDDIKYLKLTAKAIRRSKSLLVGFKSYIKRDSFTNIFFNINNILIDLEEIINLDFAFRKLLKEKSSFSLQEQNSVLKTLIKLAQELKEKKDKFKESYTLKDFEKTQKLFNKLKYRKKLNTPFVYTRELVLKKEFKKLKKLKTEDRDILYKNLKIYKDLLRFFNVDFKCKNYKELKKMAKIVNARDIIDRVAKNNISHLIANKFDEQVKKPYKLPIKKCKKVLCSAK